MERKAANGPAALRSPSFLKWSPDVSCQRHECFPGEIRKVFWNPIGRYKPVELYMNTGAGSLCVSENRWKSGRSHRRHRRLPEILHSMNVQGIPVAYVFVLPFEAKIYSFYILNRCHKQDLFHLPDFFSGSEIRPCTEVPGFTGSVSALKAFLAIKHINLVHAVFFNNFPDAPKP